MPFADSSPLQVSALDKGVGHVSAPLSPDATVRVAWSLLDEEISLPAAVLYEARIAGAPR